MWNRFSVAALGLIFSPTLAAEQMPRKFKDFAMKIPAYDQARFGESEIRAGEFVRAKASEWSACRAPTSSRPYRPFAADLNSDELGYFFDSPPIDRLDAMEVQGLTRATLPQVPWSGDYWPLAQGILGARIADLLFMELRSWLDRFNFIVSRPADSVLKTNDSLAIRQLSPSEKYDLLVGDSQQRLTEAMWSEGRMYHDEFGKVEEWMGICHGWAPASFMEERPLNSFDVMSRDQKWPIHFYPFEVKGIVSYSWAYNPYPVRFLGSRCNKKSPATDDAGRLADPECFDLNPSTWHIAIVNQVGVLRRSMIMDATYDYEVWNQPIYSYAYSYFNPQTGAYVETVEEAIVTLKSFASDRFAKHRPANAKSVVGVAMKVGYVIEVRAEPLEQESSAMDQVRWVEYIYDLELDENDKIIGGEWHQSIHPDFVWVPEPGSKPRTNFDYKLEQIPWTDASIPNEWARAATHKSASGLLLNTIAIGLLKKSL